MGVAEHDFYLPYRGASYRLFPRYSREGMIPYQLDWTEFADDEGVSTSTFAAAWKRVRKQASSVVAAIGVGKVSTAFGVTEAAVNHALAERNRTRISGEQLVYLQMQPEGEALMSMVPRMVGFDVVPQRPMTVEEKLARWESLADRMGDHGKWMRDQVYSRSK